VLLDRMVPVMALSGEKVIQTKTAVGTPQLPLASWLSMKSM
jgi:hypothetical protein